MLDDKLTASQRRACIPLKIDSKPEHVMLASPQVTIRNRKWSMKIEFSLIVMRNFPESQKETLFKI